MRPVIAVVAVLVAASRAGAQLDDVALSPAQLRLACAPPLTLAAPAPNGLRILGGQDTVGRGLFGPRDLVVVSAGTQANVQLGQRYFARRPVAFIRVAAGRSPAAHTTGWIRVVAVNETTAIALVDYACDAITTGDYLEPYVAPPPVPDAAENTPGELDFTSIGRVVFGKEERRIGGAGDFVLIDRGSAQGVGPGARFAIYRDLGAGGVPIVSVGEGIVLAATASSALMRITTSRDAIERGDYVVRRK